MTRTIVITSGKEGVGKTNISVNLALCLAALGSRTCLFDADLGLANVNMLLGLYPEYNLEDVILYHRDIEDVIIRDCQGIDIIPGGSGVKRMANLEADQAEHLIQSLSKLDGYNFLLFDTSAGISKNAISFCLASSEIMVVITPEVASLTDSYALLKMLYLNGFKGVVNVVVNQCESAAIARHACTKFKETARKHIHMNVVPLGIIIHDPKVEKAAREQQAFMLLYPESSASKSIKSIAKRLRENQPEDLKPSGTSLFWTKYLKLVKSPLKLTVKKTEKKEIVDQSSWQTQEQGPSEAIQRTEEKPVPQASKDIAEAGKLEDLEHAPSLYISKPIDDRLPASGELQPKNRRHLFEQIKTPKNLPTLPHVVLKLIEACNRDESTIQNISQIVNKDASLSVKVMSLANYECNAPHNRMTSIEEAVFLLGRDAMRTIAIGAAVHSDFDQAEDSSAFGLKQFWWHSLACATLAKLIARKASYPAPEEAYLSGLFHDIGKLVLWVNSPKEYAEILHLYRTKPDLLLESETRLGDTHCEVGAWMINRWNMQSFVADAVLYHHEPVHRILDALPLVKVVFVANALCSEAVEDTDAKFESAEKVFGFARSEVEELTSVAEKEVKQAAKPLGIELDPPDASIRSVSEKDAEKDLFRAVRDISLLQGTLQNLVKAHGEESILKVLKQSLQVLFDIHSVLFFLYDQEKNVLVCKGVDKENDLINNLKIPFKNGESLLIRSLHQKTALDSFGYSTKIAPTIMDKQLIRFLGKDGMLCLPMVANRANIGLIVLGIDAHHIGNLQDQVKPLTMFANQAALALAANHLRQFETNRLKDALETIREVLDKG